MEPEFDADFFAFATEPQVLLPTKMGAELGHMQTYYTYSEQNGLSQRLVAPIWIM